MLAHLFLGLSLIGAEWVLYLLLVLSVFSVTLIVERALFYRDASKGIDAFRAKVRQTAQGGQVGQLAQLSEARLKERTGKAPDLETEMTRALALHVQTDGKANSPDVLLEVAQDSVLRARLQWERNLSVLATISTNAPFIGLFGTVLGIIKAFHDLALQATTGAQTVTSGISEALVATAVGLLVAIPAAIAFNLYQRRVKNALAEAESLKSFLVGKLSN
jgi:biopolymer transport protein ExbB